MAELRQGYKFPLLHLAFGLLEKCRFSRREDIIGIDQLFRFNDHRTSMPLSLQLQPCF